MKVAVLMSTYNGEKFLREQIESILNQDGDFELTLIVRDDGSEDSTIDILKEYSKIGKLFWYQGDNIKTAKSYINLLVNNKGYDYYAFSDQDDVWLKDKIRLGIEKIRRYEEPAFSLSNSMIVDKDLNKVGKTTYLREPDFNPLTICCHPGIQGCGMIFNKKLADYVIDNPPKNLIMHDSYIARVCSSLQGKMVYSEKIEFLYRQHENNVIGITMGKINIIKESIKEVFTREKFGIAEQASEILKLYEGKMSHNRKKIYHLVSHYKENIFFRLYLTFTLKTHYPSLRWSVVNRLKILLGNK